VNIKQFSNSLFKTTDGIEECSTQLFLDKVVKNNKLNVYYFRNSNVILGSGLSTYIDKLSFQVKFSSGFVGIQLPIEGEQDLDINNIHHIENLNNISLGLRYDS
jgi:hypothetical protein